MAKSEETLKSGGRRVLKQGGGLRFSPREQLEREFHRPPKDS